MKNLIKEVGISVRISLMATLLLAIILCGIYPLLVWVLAQGLFPARANGSLIVHKGQVVGSSLLSQGFSDLKYFHPRPSAAGWGYDASSSGGSNLGPLSKKLVETVKQRVSDYRTQNELTPDHRVPADAVTASASGLDPHISVENAMLQIRRVAKARSLSKDVLLRKIETHTEGRTFGILGEPRVNVLMLNLDLDGRR
jgi:potassium-transporting ATPase KdpC subunit